MNVRAVFYALVSAALFGVSTPAAKALLGSIDPMVLAGLLYCGAGYGVAMASTFAGSIFEAKSAEVSLRRADLPWLAGAVLAGGVVGPFLLMFGLARTDAAATSLLLTLEGVATVLLAWFLFHENFDRRIVTGMACLVAGAAVLSWSGTPNLAGMLGPLAVIGACLAWGLDNNLTRKVSLSDPLQIVALKGVIAGPVNLAFGLWMSGTLPKLGAIAAAVVVGFFGYGLSLVLFVLALRHLGAARTSAYFSTAPFLGTAVAVVFLGEPATVQLAGAGALMALGVWLHVTEWHQHGHFHEPIEHAHPHLHDEHHRHRHGSDDPPDEPHTHPHRHVRRWHRHPHTPDMHHSHRH
jgi:drug/metabolite transporter (DMT)-like permease